MKRDSFRLILMHFICGPQSKFFGSATAWNKAYSQFDKPDIAFCSSLYFITMQTHFASAITKLLGVSPQLVTEWFAKRREPTGEKVLEIQELLKTNPPLI